jgi:tyrosine-protein kinase Etk/Wzc
MSNENSTTKISSTDTLWVYIYAKRKLLMLIGAIAFVISLVVSMLIVPLYRSTAIVFPAATSTVSFSESRNAKASAMDFGEEEQAEQLVQILESSRIRNLLLARFDLFKVYDIDPNDPNKNFKLNKAYSGHIMFERTRYGSIKIDVLDVKPERAAEIANKILDLIDTVKNDMVRERTVPAFEIAKRKRAILLTEKENLQMQLDTLSRMGVTTSQSRAEILPSLNNTKNAEDRAYILKMIKVNELYGARYDVLDVLLEMKMEKLSDYDIAYEQAESDANAALNHKFVVETAVAADKKDSPKRLIIVLLSTMSAMLFGVFMLLLWDKFQTIRSIK